jgi:uncharacterized protein (UPF0276 family)
MNYDMQISPLRRWSHEPIPARAGVGLKPEHYDSILGTRPDIGWFEVHPENYMGDGGAPHYYLSRLRAYYPISFHGVGLSIGSAGTIDKAHLSRLAALMARYEPAMFSEHLAWSTHDGAYLNDLLPLPYTAETLDLVCCHVDEVQTALGRRMLLENPSTYIAFETSDISETEFLGAIAGRTGCGLLLDVNNVFVSATNNGFDPEAYIDAFPVAHVGEIHLGGHADSEDDLGAPLLIDAHDRAVKGDVWALYRRAIARTGAVPTLIEWDNDIPTWPVLFAEALRAESVLVSRSTKP